MENLLYKRKRRLLTKEEKSLRWQKSDKRRKKRFAKLAIEDPEKYEAFLKKKMEQRYRYRKAYLAKIDEIAEKNPEYYIEVQRQKAIKKMLGEK